MTHEDVGGSERDRVAGHWYLARLFLACLILPCLFACAVWFAGPPMSLGWTLPVLVTHFAFAFLFVAAPWNRISHWLRYLAFVALVAAALHSGNWLGGLLSLGILVTIVMILRSKARAATQGALTVSFPLRGGLYCVSSGGNYLALNHHLTRPSQKHAIDLIRLNWFGNRSSGLYQQDYRAYSVYGALVYTPCDGTVTKVIDGIPDNTPPQRDSSQPAGNHVIIRYGNSDVYVGLAHLQRGSLQVCEGQQLRAGQLLGRVGNSGNATEPHLHIHAKRGGRPDSLMDGEAVPLLFDGRTLIRNDVFAATPIPAACQGES